MTYIVADDHGCYLQIAPDEGAIARCVDMESAIREVERVAISKLLGG